MPAVRWQESGGYAGQRELIDRALKLGVGGFILFGGRTDDVRLLTRDLRERSRVPLLIASDLERGAGQQFAGATGLPPLAALGWLGETETVARAGALTAREARALGVNWVYAPVMDIDIEPANPIIGTRAFGSHPDVVARLGSAWIEACQAEGVLACAKHFPGHGRTTTDSHAELPIVRASREELEEADLRPFRAAIDAGVASIMSAHIAFPAIDPSGEPATLSAPILEGVLREQLGFDGLIVTDALIMAGVRQSSTGGTAEVRAVGAGCDLLLYPEDLEAVARELAAAVARGELKTERVERSIERRRSSIAKTEVSERQTSDEEDRAWATTLALRVVHLVQGDLPAVRDEIALTVIDDDVGGPYPPPSRKPFVGTLRKLGVTVVEGDANHSHLHLIALFGDVRAWKGRPGYSAGALKQVRNAVDAARRASARAVLIQFGHPRLADSIGVEIPIVSAWGGEATMQRAAASWLAKGGK
jgi:beta-glucosidase-like glycosyl hydrolase